MSVWRCPTCMDTGYRGSKPSSLHDDPCPACGGDPSSLVLAYAGAELLTPDELARSVADHNTWGVFGDDRCECSGCALLRDRANVVSTHPPVDHRPWEEFELERVGAELLASPLPR